MTDRYFRNVVILTFLVRNTVVQNRSGSHLNIFTVSYNFMWKKCDFANDPIIIYRRAQSHRAVAQCLSFSVAKLQFHIKNNRIFPTPKMKFHQVCSIDQECHSIAVFPFLIKSSIQFSLEEGISVPREDMCIFALFLFFLVRRMKRKIPTSFLCEKSLFFYHNKIVV